MINDEEADDGSIVGELELEESNWSEVYNPVGGKAVRRW